MKNGKLIKVCGMTGAENIREAEAAGADLIGFIFYSKSPRRISTPPSYRPKKAVGVFVDAAYDEIMVQQLRFGFEYVQLHGKEKPSLCRELRETGFTVIKAFSISSKEDLKGTEEYEGCCDFFLFDAKCKSVGGSGEQFDWSILKSYNGKTPFLLSGGLGIESLDKLREFSHPKLAGYDLNSKFETAPGLKDINKLEEFINKI